MEIDGIDLVGKRIDLGDVNGEQRIELIGEPYALGFQRQESRLGIPFKRGPDFRSLRHAIQFFLGNQELIELARLRPYGLDLEGIPERAYADNADRFRPKITLKNLIRSQGLHSRERIANPI